MKIDHVTQKDYVVSNWSGGTTTQIGIGPQGAVYGDRDFLWRISSATIDLTESDFTPLPDYYRYITTLNNDIKISHNGGPFKTLKALDIHSFDGGDVTKSTGKCRDFNLMLRKDKTKGSLSSFRFDREGTVDIKYPSEGEPGGTNLILALYCVSGELSVKGTDVILKENETLFIREHNKEVLEVSHRDTVTFILAVIEIDK